MKIYLCNGTITVSIKIICIIDKNSIVFCNDNDLVYEMEINNQLNSKLLRKQQELLQLLR